MIVSDQVEDGFRTIRVRDTTIPNRKQVEFFQLCDQPEAEEIMFDGSIRMGKSQAALRKITQWAWKHGGRYAVARKTYPELINSTMKIALAGEGAMPPAIPEGLIADYIKSERTVFLKNGAEILFTNLESVEEGKAKLRNISLNGMFIDQVEELDSDDWFQFYEELLGRLSDPRGPGKMLLAANPGPTDHWAYKRFVDPETSRKFPQCRYVHGTLYDNRENLDEKYFQGRIRTKDQNPEYYKRMVLGEWGSFGSKRFKVFDRAKHVVQPFTIPKWWEVIEGIDYGYSHPFVALWVAIDPHERYYVFAEHYERERLISHHANAIKAMREEWSIKPAATYADPQLFYAQAKNSSSSVSLELNDHDIFPGKADNDRLGGWNRIEEMLSTYIEGAPQLRFFTHCKHLIREIPNLRIKDNSDDVEKKNDDACLVAGTMVATPAGETAIEHLRLGDLVLTRKGPRPVEAVALTLRDEPVFDVAFTDGTVVTANASHPFYMTTGCYPVRNLESGMCVAAQTSKMPTGRLARYGRRLTGKSLGATIFTTSIKTPLTTAWRTLSACLPHSTLASTPIQADGLASLRLHGRLSGTAPRKEGSGRPKTGAGFGSNGKHRNGNAINAGPPTKPGSRRDRGFATRTAKPVFVASVSPAGRSDVYDITVSGEHEFFANGILVGNSDCLRYIVMSRPPVPKEPDADDPEGDDRRSVYLRRQQEEVRGEYLDPYRDIDLMGV